MIFRPQWLDIIDFISFSANPARNNDLSEILWVIDPEIGVPDGEPDLGSRVGSYCSDRASRDF